MNDKAQIIATLRDEFSRWEALLAGKSEAQITTPDSASQWSVKDVMAHLWSWQQRSIARMEAALHNREPVFPDWPTHFDPEVPGQPDQLNAWLFESNRDKRWSVVYGDWKAGFLRLIELAEAIPETDLLDPARYAWLEGHTLAFILLASVEHHQEHRENETPAH